MIDEPAARRFSSQVIRSGRRTSSTPTSSQRRRCGNSYQSQKVAGVVDPDVSNKRKGNSVRKGIDLDPLRVALQEISIKGRTTQCGLAFAL